MRSDADELMAINYGLDIKADKNKKSGAYVNKKYYDYP